jgi:hypothetical protein
VPYPFDGVLGLDGDLPSEVTGDDETAGKDRHRYQKHSEHASHISMTHI